MKELTSKKRFLYTTLVLLIITLNLSCFGTIHMREEEKAEADRRSVDQGEVLYQKYCARCHGDDGSGNGPMAKHLRQKPANLAKKDLFITNYGLETIIDYPHLSEEAVSKTVRHGNQTMDSSKNKLRPEEIKDLTNFLKTKIFK